MRYLHTLDPYEISEAIERMREMEYFAAVAELEAEDRAMEKYYDKKESN